MPPIQNTIRKTLRNYRTRKSLFGNHLVIRIVLHAFPDESRHLDLFLLEDFPLLTTFEISEENTERVLHLLSRNTKRKSRRMILGNRLEIDQYIRTSETSDNNRYTFPLIPKKDHRDLYRSYSGPISGNRGKIHEVFRGRVGVMDRANIVSLMFAV